jgi:hypothetical protein
VGDEVAMSSEKNSEAEGLGILLLVLLAISFGGSCSIGMLLGFLLRGWT